MGPQPGQADFGTGLKHAGMVLDLLRFSAVEAVEDLAPLLHPDMRVMAAPGVAPARRYQTREDFLEYFSDASSRGILVEPDLRELRLSPSGAVIVSGTIRMTSPAGTDEVPAWFVYTFRDGLIASLENHLCAALAEEAAGMTARGND